MMRIGELAKKVGITTQAIRYYERIGLFENPARNPSGYRIYEDEVGLLTEKAWAESHEKIIRRKRVLQDKLRTGT